MRDVSKRGGGGGSPEKRPYDVSRGQNRYVTLPFILSGNQMYVKIQASRDKSNLPKSLRCWYNPLKYLAMEVADKISNKHNYDCVLLE